ncbi:type VII toxin-antitoxin system HepT family RNase toxin [Caldisericum sp.]|uniref:type VII toxin-antitoxin system HepT family RNase toxin n=1 Tax=Caldisericum sp. TaxID=2499687 RepID=UPI003D0E7B79
MRIVDLIMRFEMHSKNAREVAEKDVSDYFVYSTLAMECLQSVNALIEIGEWIVTEKNFGFPSTYREIFELLYNNKIIDKESFEKIKRLIFLRNLIFHEYHRISKDELIEMVDLLKSIEKFINYIKEMER